MSKSVKRSAQPIIIPAFTEAEFLQQIIQAARLAGWMVFHTYDSRLATGTGYPDLTFVHPTVFTHVSGKSNFFFAEIKTEKGDVKPEQRQWLEALAMNGVEFHVWRPSDINMIIERLQVA